MDGMQITNPWARAALANPHDHPEVIRMPHAKFRAHLLETVALHKEQKADRQTFLVLYIYKILFCKVHILYFVS